MKAVITKSCTYGDLSHIFPYIPYIGMQTVYKRHCTRCAACERIATLPRGTRGIVNAVAARFTPPCTHLRQDIHRPRLLRDLRYQLSA